MRCSCPMCETYMVHHEKSRFECICPHCGNTCRICMGEGFGKPAIVKTSDGKVKIPDELFNRFDKRTEEKK